ncbi:MAG: hypothetical protein RJQ08_08565 [Salinisphaeraceae bacterium]
MPDPSHIGQVPAEAANQAIRSLLVQANEAENPGQFYADVLSLVASTMAAQMSHEAADTALRGVLCANRAHLEAMRVEITTHQ